MSFNTGNPLPSKDILDLYDNSENIDHFANSQEDEHPDRFGVKRLTLAGLIKRSMALRNEINDFSGALTFKPEWSDVPMNVSEGVGGEGGALNLQAEALGNRSEINKITSREALRRIYLHSEYNLIEGSFETGAIITSTTDVVLHEKTGKCYSGPIGEVPKGTNPLNGSFVDCSLEKILDSQIVVKPIYPGSEFRTLEQKNGDYFDVSEFPSIQSAIDYISTLTSVEYGPTLYQNADSPQYSSITRTLRLQGKKIVVDNPVVLKGSVSIDAQGGGLIASDKFPVGEPILTQEDGYYSGSVSDITIDGANRNVKGVLVTNAYHSRWNNIRVVCCANDGIVYTGGFEFFLSNFEIVCADKPAHQLVVGLKICGSDSHILNGALRYHPFGVWFEGGGNNYIGFVHTWGLYSYNKQKVCFVVKNSPNNKFTMCTADSPAKSDWSKSNLHPIEGYVNGGIGFYVDVGSNGTSFSHCTTYINETAFFVDGKLSYTNWLNPYRVASERVKIIDPEVVISSVITGLKVTFDETKCFETSILIGLFDGIGDDFDRLGKRQEFGGYIRVPNTVSRITGPINLSSNYTVDPVDFKCQHLIRTGNAFLSIANPPVSRDGTGTVEINLLIEKGTSEYTLQFDGSVIGRVSEVNINSNTTKLFTLQFISSINKWLLTNVCDYG